MKEYFHTSVIVSYLKGKESWQQVWIGLSAPDPPQNFSENELREQSLRGQSKFWTILDNKQF